MLIMSGAAGTVLAHLVWLCSRSSPPLLLNITVISYRRELFQLQKETKLCLQKSNLALSNLVFVFQRSGDRLTLCILKPVLPHVIDVVIDFGYR